MISHILSDFSSFVWGPPLIILLLGTGFFLTLRFAFIQVRAFCYALGIVAGKYDREDDPGQVSHFKALATALSGTIGTGNIVGVASAILLGGPGALFWMWITAMIGMASKFVSCTLAVHFRRIDEHGEVHCGPMHYIEMGMGPKFKWLAVLFAFATVTASFGIGNMFQMGSITSAFDGITPDLRLTTGVRLAIGVVFAVMTALVIIGGIKRIARVTSILTPFMTVFYIGAALLILFQNFDGIIPAFQTIFYHAFHAPEAVAGGVLGGVIRQGVARGLFSNEAGLGSEAMAHGTAKTKWAVREGFVAMLGPFIDTLVICTMTGLVIIISGLHETVTAKGQLTAAAFDAGLPGSGWMVYVATVLFAYSTVITWSHYGDRAADYLFGPKAVVWYRWVYVGVVVMGAVRPLGDIINFCDGMNGLMALPNLIAMLVLSPVVAKLLREYSRAHHKKF